MREISAEKAQEIADLLGYKLEQDGLGSSCVLVVSGSFIAGLGFRTAPGTYTPRKAWNWPKPDQDTPEGTWCWVRSFTTHAWYARQFFGVCRGIYLCWTAYSNSSEASLQTWTHAVIADPDNPDQPPPADLGY